MLKDQWRNISRLERVIDNALIVGTFFLSYHLRDVLLVTARSWSFELPLEPQTLGPVEDYLIVLGCSLPLFNAALSLLGGYRSMRLRSYLWLFERSVLSAGVVFLALGSILYLLKLDLSRSFVGIFCAISGVGLFLVRVTVLLLLRYFRSRGKNYRNVLIVGTGQQARQLYQEIGRQVELGIRVVGFTQLNGPDLENGEPAQKIDSTHASSAVYDLAARIVADAESFEAALKKHAVDEVLFTDVVQTFHIVNELARIAVEEGVRVTLAADLFSLNILKSDISYFGSVPLIHYNPSPIAEQNSALLVKRAVDVVIASAVLLILSPLLLLVAILIKLDSRGPVFFRQKRVGLNGRTFVLLKFRSMVDGAESMLEELKDRNEMSGPVFKIRRDPRVTRIGKFLRKFSIDEFPQLLNVLRGDMSLVGPRPPLPEEVSLYVRRYRRRLSMRPGLTCIWQVSGRNGIPDFDTWAKLDLEYIDTWSLWNDFKLLARTIPAVISGSGAQ